VEPAIVVVCLSVCLSVCVSHTNISETKQDQIVFPTQNLPTELQQDVRKGTVHKYYAILFFFLVAGQVLFRPSMGDTLFALLTIVRERR